MTAEATDDKKRAEEELDKLNKNSLKFTVSAYNATSRIAHHVYILIHINKAKAFLECDCGREIIEEKSHKQFTFSGDYIALKEVQEKIIKYHGSGYEFMFQHMLLETVSYIAVTFPRFSGKPISSQTRVHN